MSGFSSALSQSIVITLAPRRVQSAWRRTSVDTGETSTMPGDEPVDPQFGLSLRWKSGLRDGCRLVLLQLNCGDVGDG